MDSRTDEKWYKNEYEMDIKRVLRILAIVVIVAAVSWGIGAWMEARHVPALPGEVILKGNMSLEEADRKVREAGYIPKGEVSRDEEGSYSQAYESSEAFGYDTKGSVLGVKKYGGNKYVLRFLYFDESSVEYKADNPGKVFNDILNELTSRIGADPVIIYEASFGNRWCWDLKGKTTVNLCYVADGVVSVGYSYKE